jgi:hypothetical protein
MNTRINCRSVVIVGLICGAIAPLAGAAIVGSDNYDARNLGTLANSGTGYTSGTSLNYFARYTSPLNVATRSGSDRAAHFDTGGSTFAGVLAVLPTALTVGSAVGDGVRMRFDIRVTDNGNTTGNPTANGAGFRFGLYNANATAVTSGNSTASDNDFGFGAQLPTTTATGATLYREVGGTGTATGGSDVTGIGTAAGSVAVNQSGYNAVELTLTRNASNGTLALAFNNSIIRSETVSFSGAGGSDPVSRNYGNFDSLAFFSGNVAIDIFVDNLVAETFSSNTAPVINASSTASVIGAGLSVITNSATDLKVQADFGNAGVGASLPFTLFVPVTDDAALLSTLTNPSLTSLPSDVLVSSIASVVGGYNISGSVTRSATGVLDPLTPTALFTYTDAGGLSDTINIQFSAVPEPSSLILAPLAGLIMLRRRTAG